MRCKACDVILDDLEILKKDANGVHYDLCTECLTVSIATHWDLENPAYLETQTEENLDNSGTILQDDVLTLQENYDTILHKITKDY